MFETRGFLLDARSGRLPTPKTFRLVVDLLAAHRYNRLLLALPPPVAPNAAQDGWDDVEEITPAECARLDAYCRMQGLELVAAPEAPALGLADASAAKPLLWADPFLAEPARLADLPREATLLVRGYEANHPFERECAALAAAGCAFHVCAGTSAWRALGGRVENMRENLEAAEAAGRLHGASGYVVADWGLDGHFQPLAASLPGLILGGAFAASGAKAAKMDLERALDRTMDAPLGGLLLRLGTLYLRGGAVRAGCSELYNILTHDHGYSRHPGLTDAVLDDISGVAHGVAVSAGRWADRNDWAKEIVYMADLIDCACHRRDEPRLRALREEHGRIWRLRARESGRVASLQRLPRF